MNPLKSLLVLCLAAACACIDLPAVDEPQQPPPAEPRLEVRLSSPSDTVYTRGDVPVQVTVTGGEAEKVELLLDNVPLVNLAPPYSYTWGTSGVAEGHHTLSARAVRKGEPFTSAARTVVVDRTPPQVVTLSPAPGAQGVSVHAPIRIEFSEPLLRSSVTTNAFGVTVGTVPMEFGIQVDGDGRAVEIALPRSPPVPNLAEVNLSSTLVDLAGNALAVPAGAWTWQFPALLSIAPSLSGYEGTTHSYNPSLAFDGSTGAPVVVWSEVLNTEEEVFVRRWVGGQWVDLGGMPAPPHLAMLARRTPRLALKKNGQPVVGYLQVLEDRASRAVAVAEFDGMRWNTLVNGGCGGASGAYGLSMVLDSDDQPWVAIGEFYPASTDTTKVYVCRLVDGRWEAVGTPLVLSGDDNRADILDLQINALGRPVVAWLQGTSGMVHRWSGVQWERLMQVNARSVVLSLGRDGRPYAAWTGFDRKSLAVARLDPWQYLGPILSPENNQGEFGQVALVLDGDDQPVMSWFEGELLYLKRSGEARTLAHSLNASPANGWRLALNLDRAGVPVVAYPGVTEVGNSIFIMRYNQ